MSNIMGMFKCNAVKMVTTAVLAAQVGMAMFPGLAFGQERAPKPISPTTKGAVLVEFGDAQTDACRAAVKDIMDMVGDTYGSEKFMDEMSRMMKQCPRTPIETRRNAEGIRAGIIENAYK